MNSKEIFDALKKGSISIADAEKELKKIQNESEENRVVDLAEIESGIVQVTIKDKINKNTFTKELVDGLSQAFKSINASDKYKVVILNGYDNYFLSGGTKEGLLAIYEGKTKFTDIDIYSLPLECKIPVIAAMQGHGIGAGWSIGMLCDFIIMSRECYYESNYMKYGFTPGAGATFIFPEKLGIGLAQEILFTGKRFRGSQLEAKGIPFPVLPKKEVIPYAIELAKEMAAAPRESLVALKERMVGSMREKLANSYAKELKMHERTFVNQPEVKERIEALFAEQSTKKQETIPSTVNTEPGSYENMADNSIAIIGMSGQFPKSKDVNEFWNNIANGKDCISEIPTDRWSINEYYDSNPKAKGKTYCKCMGVLEDIDKFDPLFFNILPVEAELMDPQQRLMLENCWHCIEDAGINPYTLSGTKCGVFVGCVPSSYGDSFNKHEINAQSFIGSSSSILSARISYLLNLKGPCLAIDTACSSSLVAIAEACNSLILHNSDIALAGGVYVSIGPNLHIGTSKAMMLSKDGRCFTFDDRANGFVPGEGVGVILLKRLEDAIRDKDPIQGVIKGWGMNQDGKTNGITAPSTISQVGLEKEVYQRFNINPETISLVETHGTGTILGDPIEVEALIESFSSYTHKKNYCALSSAKSNVGHLLTAAGIASVCKVLLALKHKTLPPTINFEVLNRHISLDDSPFYINTKLKPWKAEAGIPRRACVSAFGFSGTNAHLVIEEYVSKQDERKVQKMDEDREVLFVLSAKSKEQLKIYAKDVKEWMESKDESNLLNLAYTLQVGRAAMDYRLAFIADSKEMLLNRLDEYINDYLSDRILSAKITKDISSLLDGEEPDDLIQNLIDKGELDKLLELWVNGLNVQWDKLYPNNKPRRITIPGYPFAKESYWLPENNKTVNDVTINNEIVNSSANNTKNVTDKIEADKLIKNLETITHDDLVTASVEHLRTLMIEVTKIPEDRLDVETHFEELGLDSIIISIMNQKVEKWTGKLDTTLFFKYNTVKALGEYIAENHKDAVESLIDDKAATPITTNINQPIVAEKNISLRKKSIENLDRQTDCDIAIIGISGHYPQADTLEEFWQNLYEGKDCIEEIPTSRWSLEGFYEPNRVKAVETGLSYSKWGGFLKDIDCFDPLFFNISPINAMDMDPQERLFLESAWACVEDAGYTRESLRKERYSNRIGVFAGATFNNYQLLKAEEAFKANREMYTASGQIFTISNRVSYVMNFTGPSLTVDTACSSSLYAVHLACESIKRGESSMAVAGGVNLSLHPSKYIALSQTQFASTDGRCRAFCEGGTGYVPSEGVGTILLKPLDDAIEDGDHIYGIIKGSGVSHAGTTNGYTVPSPVAQSQAIEDALIYSNIHPRSISCIEAHGTGTALGDPIEIAGLKDVFEKYTEDKGFCSISSVKSNIGHAEAAAGMAQLAKVLLEMKHKTLAKNVMHGKGLNKNIDFDDSPFVVQQKTENWNRPIIENREIPRRAGISSFGAGGTNVHLIVEEYTKSEQSNIVINTEQPVVIVLSARNQERLKEQIKQLLCFMDKQKLTDRDLPSIAYTLQVGREAMEERIALIAENTQNVKSKLQQFIDGKEDIHNLKQSRIQGNKHNIISSKELEEIISDDSFNNCYLKIIDLWVNGVNIDWDRLYKDVKPIKISLPTYPFAKEKYWVSNNEDIREQKIVHEEYVSTDTSTLMLQPVWIEQDIIEEDNSSISFENHLIILCEPDMELQDYLQTNMNNKNLLILDSRQDAVADRFEEYAIEVFNKISGILKEKPTDSVFVQVIVFEGIQQQLFTGLSGLLKTTWLENPKLVGQIIQLEMSKEPDEIIEILEENVKNYFDNQVLIKDNKRLISSWSEVKVSGDDIYIPWKDGGIYLITGGLGGLGLKIAKNIADKTSNSTLILLGRSTLNENKSNSIQELIDKGSTVLYKQTDITIKEDIVELIDNIQIEYGHINGIIHTAGIIQDNFIIKKTAKEFQDVLAPKVKGLENLDCASKDIKLDFFVLFSSIAGIFGNLGQADYAAANAFMDAYAKYRNHLVDRKQRYGQTVSINWPLWKDGGMSIDQETENILKQETGMIPMKTETGISMLYHGLASNNSQLMVLDGESDKLRRFIDSSIKQQSNNVKPSDINVDIGQLREKTLYNLKLLFGKTIKLSVDRIREEEPLENYGVDSIIIMQLNQKIANVFGEVSKTLFYEYQTLGALSEYFITDHIDKCIEWTGFMVTNQSNDFIEKKNKEITRGINHKEVDNNHEPIAIIGMSGKYPQAKNLDEYWENLKDGKDCITTIPEERWKLDGFFQSDINKAVADNKSYGKWGGFIDGFADFDPLFFKISPREAMNMDPQERLFIESCWQVLEDAGYTKNQLEIQNHRKVGVFAGITKTGFDLYAPNLWEEGKRVFPHTSFSSVANRISYLLNLQGPSMPVDTMCSSSLTAVHEACEHIYNGDCEMAIAGGVNLYVHPSNYVALSAQKMLSIDGKCKSFGQGANGFVPGEGVGCILLKPLSMAVEDEDHIYAVIKGTSINHGGKTNGYTVPNPNAQGKAIRGALDKAGVNSRTVSYIEAHGTGTELGDPIEITGLNKAFGKDTKDKGFCAIGSVKSNIGHLEAAAGIAGITKVVLQMNNRSIVPSLHSKELNPNINFHKTPFVVQQELTKWERPNITINGEKKEFPRIAGVSAFGAGGANAHVVIEEYIPKVSQKSGMVKSQNSVIVVLSAKGRKQLLDQVQQLLKAVDEKQYSDSDLSKLAYTLQTGREAMDERLAVVVKHIPDLKDKLGDYIEGKDGISELYEGQVKNNKDMISFLGTDEDIQEAVWKWVKRKKYSKLLGLWVRGLNIDWNKLYDGNIPGRISLPTYPFTRQRYWLVEANKSDKAKNIGNGISISNAYRKICDIEPLKGRRISSPLKEIQYEYIIGTDNLKEIQDNSNVLHVGYYLEMLSDSIKSYFGISSYTIIDMSFIRALKFIEDNYKVIDLVFTNEEDDLWKFYFYSKDKDGDDWLIHAKGHININEHLDNMLQANSLLAITEQDNMQYSSMEFYELIEEQGFGMGNTVKWIDQVWKKGEDLVTLFRPWDKTELGKNYCIGVHPGIFDSCAQLFVLTGTDNLQENTLFMMTEIQELTLNCDDKLDKDYDIWCYMKLHQTNSSEDYLEGDYKIFTDDGLLIAQAKKVKVKKIEKEILKNTINRLNRTKKGINTISAKGSVNYEIEEELQDKVVSIVSEQLGMDSENINIDEALMDMGMDSIIAIDIRHGIKKILGVEVPTEEILQGPTIREMTKILEDIIDKKSNIEARDDGQSEIELHDNSELNKWISYRIVKKNPAFRLFCLPYGSGGGASLFKNWHKKLPDDVEICPIQLPGKENRIKEKPFIDINMAVDTLKNILLQELDVPYGFYGHSIGALIAYRLAYQLWKELDNKPKHLFVGAYTSPVIQPNPLITYRKEKFEAMGFDDIPNPDIISSVSDEQLVKVLKVIDFNSNINDEVLKALLPTVLSELKMVKDYKNMDEDIFDIPITAFHGIDDDVVKEKEMRLWCKLTKNKFRFHTLSGNHLFLHEEQSQEKLLKLIAWDLNNYKKRR
ncbi:SDR family NAD(P)-dependent oxidoreductase [Vallitalea maricola]|uniref:Uncharacterized protein n=1 Tax=Vallitalea maricola TaxID=3074433 RepID=A0ACB5UN13_9FIRM|nr:hypothetical protein AN2V17_31800 [Vallitalea sp. AN17-2]